MDAAQRPSSPVRRTLRHWLSTRAEAERLFPPPTLAAITEAITAGEQTHRGEVRLIVEKALPWHVLRSGVRGRQRALTLFADHGLWDTEENCGVLLYVNLADHTIDIVADRGIARKIDNATWQGICDTMSAGFARHQYEAATLGALAQVNELLRRHFPTNGPRPNELPDGPLML
ncbi:MAG TPA: TPM domain-containing protein [Telluria sp.]